MPNPTPEQIRKLIEKQNQEVAKVHAAVSHLPTVAALQKALAEAEQLKALGKAED